MDDFILGEQDIDYERRVSAVLLCNFRLRRFSGRWTLSLRSAHGAFAEHLHGLGLPS